MSIENENEKIENPISSIENNPPILVKKRGRKPKNRDNIVVPDKNTEVSKKIPVIIQPQVKKIPTISKIENTILFFPIKSDSTEVIKKNNTFSLSNLKNNSIEPIPYDPNINLNSHFAFGDSRLCPNLSSYKSNLTLDDSSTIKDNQKQNSLDDAFDCNQSSENTTSHSFAYVLNEANKNKNLNLNALNKNIKVIPILNEFIKTNENKKMPEKTKMCCYWDTEPFDWEPLGLPERKIGSIFYVKHCFCSFSCMASYNFRINDDKVWERYALINLMYKLTYNINQNVKVKLAPPIESLEKFGGIYNINDFRKLNESKLIKVQSFPLINIQSYLEEINIQLNDNQSSNSISQSDVKNYLDKVNNDYKLSRNKFGISKNTLELCMGLKKNTM